MIIQPRLALFAALLSPAILLFGGAPWIALAGVGVIVALVWFADWLLSVPPSEIGLSRKLPNSVTLGRTGTVSWLIHNASQRATSVGFSDGLAPSLAAQDRRATLRLKAGNTATVETELEPRRRGRFEIAEMVVRTLGPLGFAGRQQTRWVSEDLRVFPRFPSRADAELRVRRSRLELGTRSARRRGGGSEFEQLRDFTVDDEFRRIDWAATARANRLIVRTFRTERNQTVINVLDNGRLMAGQVDEVPRAEHAMDAIMAPVSYTHLTLPTIYSV